MTINSKHIRTRRFARIRHGRRLSGFLADIASALSATPAAHTVAPVHTSQIGPEATLTISGGSVAALDTVTVGSALYKFVTALTEVFASSTLTTDNTNASDGSTVVIGTRTYTFQTSLTAGNGHVKIGTDADTSLLNLARAINQSGGTQGTDYDHATTPVNADVAASATVTSHAITLTAKESGVAANSLALSASTSPNSHITVGHSTLQGGVDASTDNEVLVGNGTTGARDNLIAAITGSGAAGKYQTNIVALTDYTASAASANVLVQSTESAGVRPAAKCVLASTSAHAAAGAFSGPNWTATSHGIEEGEGPFLLTSDDTLPAGSPADGTELYVHVVSADVIAIAVGREALRNGAFLGTTDAGTGTHSLARSVTAQGMLSTLERGVKPRTAAAATDVDGL